MLWKGHEKKRIWVNIIVKNTSHATKRGFPHTNSSSPFDLSQLFKKIGTGEEKISFCKREDNRVFFFFSIFFLFLFFSGRETYIGPLGNTGRAALRLLNYSSICLNDPVRDQLRMHWGDGLDSYVAATTSLDSAGSRWSLPVLPDSHPQCRRSGGGLVLKNGPLNLVPNERPAGRCP